MKKLLIITFLFIHVALNATIYYVKNSGNDNNTGLSDSQAWATIAKANSSFSTLSPGDQILFKRGDTFFGTIRILKSGMSGNPIIIGAYGTGKDPVITGFAAITSWKSEGNNIYSGVIGSESPSDMVTVDGINTGMGRYPDVTYLTYESCVTNRSVTDTGLGDATDWAGADLIIRKNRWTLDRCLITDHTGDVLTYANLFSTQNATAKYGYFVQNDLRTVTVTNEWFHDIQTGKFYIYGDPATKKVRVATLNNLVYNNGYKYITIENLSFEGAIKDALYFGNNNDHNIITNCKIEFSGEGGILFGGSYTTIENNTISNCNRDGIWLSPGGTDINVVNNTITAIGIVPGQNKDAGGTAGIVIGADNCLVQYNYIENTGYDGIDISPTLSTITIKNNFINNVCKVSDDGGGIYLTSPRISVLIEGNIVLNATGNIDGTPNTSPLAMGIYLDEFSSKVTATNNTVAHCSSGGFFLHKAHDNIVSNNTSFDNASGIIYSNWTEVPCLYNNVITGNIFISKSPSQYVASFGRSIANDILNFGTSDNNNYSRPIAAGDIFYTNYNYGGKPEEKLTLAEWQSLTHQDANSHTSPVNIKDTSEIEFYYNATKTNKVIGLKKPMIDAKGTRYVNSVTLLPFTSRVLIVDPGYSQVNLSPVIMISNPIKGTQYNNPSSIDIQVVASDPDGTISKVVLFNGSTQLAELTSAPYLYSLKDVDTGTYSLKAVAYDNQNAATASSVIVFTVIADPMYDSNSEILALYPNPNDGHFYIEFKDPVQNDRSNISITDLAGKQIYNGLLSKEETIKQFDLSYIKAGIYLLIIFYREILVTKKFIKY